MSSPEHTVCGSRVPWWNDLFPARGDSAPPLRVRIRVLRKGGEPFLVLPAQGRLAAMALQLYPGQRLRGRLASGALAMFLRSGLCAPLPCTTQPLWPEDPLIRFLAQLAADGPANASLPPFAVLAGNPSTTGRRFVLLVWQSDGKPAAVVKAGNGPDAQRLIEREAAFLRLIPRPARGIPEVLDAMSAEGVRAFALPFVAGRNPPLAPSRAVKLLLSSWLNPAWTVRASAVPAWTTLRGACAGDAAFEALAPRIEEREFAAGIAHGDFAPWNLRVGADGECTALDWERGALPGMPGWDWFHYCIQAELLVRRTGPARMQSQLEALLASPEFRAYAQAAGLAGREHIFLLTYLHHVVRVLRPEEGLSANRELLERLTPAWARYVRT